MADNNRCHRKCPQFNCACENADWMSVEPECVPFRHLCDAQHDCSNKADEIDCICPLNHFQCGPNRGGDVMEISDIYNCIDERRVENPRRLCWFDIDNEFSARCDHPFYQCDGLSNCEDGRDERNCDHCPIKHPHPCACNQPDEFTCLGLLFTSCYSDEEICNGHCSCEDCFDEENCTCRDDQFTCDCYKTNPKSCFFKRSGCISMSQHCDGDFDCDDRSDENGCTCKSDQFTCDCYKADPKSCADVGCISKNKLCDGIFDCDDGSDENGCLCKDDLFDWIYERLGCSTCKHAPFTCDCYKTQASSCHTFSSSPIPVYRGCIPINQRCDGAEHCHDGSDEKGCTCRSDLFTCDCYKTDVKSCSGSGCILNSQYLDGQENCGDASDEPMHHYKKVTREINDVIIRRFTSIEQCSVYHDCDVSTCIVVPSLNCTNITACNSTQFICMSPCNAANFLKPCNSVFQCESGELEIANNFCDGKFDCLDKSDEIGNQPGFKCSSSFGRCVLPQRNLHDDVAQCEDGSDLCSHTPCFKCFDRRLIVSQTQLCDGIIDCFDLSDECLCDVYLRKLICEEMFVVNDLSQLSCESPRCDGFTSSSIESAQCQTRLVLNESNVTTSSGFMPSLIRCKNKLGEVKAVTCDGRPECSDFSDECSCENPPRFCSDRCHDFYQLGDRYCDGIIDEAWKFINNSSCPEGFDEKSCPQRFACKAGTLVSIDRVQVCDGKVDCDDGSDEVDCKKECREAIFSSQTEMIARIELRIIFWLMSLLILIGNSVVIFSTTRLLCAEKIGKSHKINHILMINLSVSDFLMGIYLFTISIKSVQYSGNYGKADYVWRSSLECSIIGSLAVISSETSCFIMTILTAYRLYNVFKPFTARTASTLKWRFAIVLAWSISLILALLPIFKATSSYFVHEIWFSNKFTSREGWNKTDVMTFACRLASLTNQSIKLDGDAWESAIRYLCNNFNVFSSRGEVGYYGETSICMPRIYTTRGDQTWVYSFVIITFNLCSFIFVAISYLLMYYKVSKRPIHTNINDEQATQMQRRIARLIATDFACWIPICIIAYLKVGGVEISKVVYLVTAGVLLPINSALNPLLYSPIIEKYIGYVCSEKKRNVQQRIQLMNLS